jgi:hypothetical protein
VTDIEGGEVDTAAAVAREQPFVVEQQKTNTNTAPVVVGEENYEVWKMSPLNQSSVPTVSWLRSERASSFLLRATYSEAPN